MKKNKKLFLVLCIQIVIYFYNSYNFKILTLLVYNF